MPAMTGRYSANETIIYNKLKSLGLNTAVICGILANIYAESGYNSKNLQNSYESKLGYNDESYTNAVDSGRYKNFSSDSAGYGLIQWTYSTRKRALLNYAKHMNKSISDIGMQIQFMINEIQSGYKSTWNIIKNQPNSSRGAYEAAWNFCYHYEAPAGKATSAINRGNTAASTFWNYYSNGANDVSMKNTGGDIVKAARATINTSTTFGDGASLVQYAYGEAGVSLPDMSASDYYRKYQSSAKKVSLSELSAGDLIFYQNDRVDMAIATGEGSRIYVDPTTKKTKEDKSLSSRDVSILRILSTADTTQSLEYVSENYTDIDFTSTNQSVSDPNALIVSRRLSAIESEGYTYGYLLDMVHGGEFKFYVPEFTEAAGANWGDIELKGRSVQVKTYQSTTSRSVTVTLDLYAGAGFYTATSGEDGLSTVDRLHQDAYFLKSLEYPDYSNVITRPPTTVLLVLGDAFELTGVVSGVTVEHLKPLDSKNRAMYLKVSFTVTQTAVNPPDYRDIRSGKNTITHQTGMVDSTWSYTSPNIPNINPTVTPKVEIPVPNPPHKKVNEIWSVN